MAAIGSLVYANPFRTERKRWEAVALGDEHEATGPVWHWSSDAPGRNPNRGNEARLAALTTDLLEAARQRLADGAVPGDGEVELYRDLVFYHLYYRFQERFLGLVTSRRRSPVRFFSRYEEELRSYLPGAGAGLAATLAPEHLFAVAYQLRRAFHLVFRHIVGASEPAAELRARVWESIFTADVRRYLRSVYRRMGEITTLVVGPSGTGKELVARAVGGARYLPFDRATESFGEASEEQFYPLDLAALSPTLVESELFGHRRGAFTGAVDDRSGWLEVCPELGTVFLDEIGEVEPALQVKLLRAIETRTFQRLGETRPRRFLGKLVAATNRDLAREVAEGRFREDLYYRLCADVVETPALAARLASSPDELPLLLAHLARRLVGEEEGEELAAEARQWIEDHLGLDYPWPGNVRELAQCVSNVLVRGSYRPLGRPATDPSTRLAEQVRAGTVPVEELVARYTALVYRSAGSYVEAARRLGLDRRTVKRYVEQAGDEP